MTSNTTVHPTRSLLYYPTISVPSGAWLRQTLLYWDNVASIVPSRLDPDDDDFFTTDIEYLRDNKVFREIHPDELIHSPGGSANLKSFENEFHDLVMASEFQKLLRPGGLKRAAARVPGLGRRLAHVDHEAPIHIGKVSNQLYQFLESEGLAIEDPRSNNWFLFESRTALLYMSLLAQHLCQMAPDYIIPGTDRSDYQSLVTGGAAPGASSGCFAVTLTQALPVPRAEQALEDILDFKSKRHHELLAFRAVLDQSASEIAMATSTAEIKGHLIAFQEKYQKAVGDLETLMNDHNMETFMGSMKTLVDIKSSTLWGALLVAAGNASDVATIPLHLALSGLAVTGTIQVGAHLVSSEVKKRAALRESPFSYLYHAKAEGVL